MKRYKIFLGLLLSFILFFTAFLAIGEIGAYYVPKYSKKNIAEILENGVTEDEYKILNEQTGLSKGLIDDVLKKEDAYLLLEKFQNQNFTEFDIDCDYLYFPVTKEEQLKKDGKASELMFPEIKDGDILLTKSSHTLLFRHGHVGIVTDADSMQVLEAMCLGMNSLYSDFSKWQSYPSIVILRPKNLEKEDIKKIVDYAKYNLFDIKYSFTAGFFENEDDIKRTHCSHLVWKAYKSAGVDIDSNGGFFVLPDDILKSDKLEIVWSYGINTKK